MLDRMEAGDMLLVSKLDRIGRDMVDVISTLRSLAARSIKVNGLM